jgi:two-component system nitrogen regulation response regulator NtrX
VKSVKLLIIDDEKNILTSLKTALSLEGFEVIVAGSGEIGLEKLKQEKIDLVMLDVKMPGIDGIETLRRIKKDSPGMPVVMMSGHGNIQTALDAIRNGAIDFVEKPLSTERLIVTIRNTLHIEELERGKHSTSHR